MALKFEVYVKFALNIFFGENRFWNKYIFLYIKKASF